MSKARLIHFLICGLIISYWFNLTILETRIFGGINEFRLYDFLGIPLILVTYSTYSLRSLFRIDLFYKKLYWFLIWCSITAIFTIIYSVILQEFTNVGSTIMFLYHFWVFFLAGLLILVAEGERRLIYIQIFIFMAFVQTIIIWLQVGGVIGHLIKYYYLEDMYTGMVGPNRIVPGMMCNIGGTLSLFILISPVLRKLIKFPIKIFAAINVLLWIPTLIMTTSRTSMVFFAVMIFIWIILFARKFLPILIFSIPLFIILFQNIGESQKQRIDRTIEYNKTKYEQAQANDPDGLMDYYYTMGNNRYQIMMRTIAYMAYNPHLFITGQGFNNKINNSRNFKALVPHNMYLNMLLEGGIISFVLYFGWLWAYVKYFHSLSRLKELKIAAGLFFSFLIAMLVSLFGGEHLYVYRSHYAIMGAFLAVMSMAVSSLDLLIDNNKDQCSEEKSFGE